jgi:phosphoglycolate phosphatase-like HAD superfamily hydrolase
VIVGYTPLDVDCARASGCRSLAVATGRSPADELAAAGADRVVADLADRAALARWILGG